MDTPQATPSEPSARMRRDIESVSKLVEKFVVQVKTRAGSTTRKDKFYVDPETRPRFFSKKDSERYLLEGNTRHCKKQPEKLTEQEMEAIKGSCQMGKESVTTSIEATKSKPPSPKQSNAKVIEEAISVEQDVNAIIVYLSQVQLPPSTFSSNEADIELSHAISESAPPLAIADTATGNTSSVVTSELDISDFEIITSDQIVEFRGPTMVDMPSEMRPPADLESELAFENTEILDALHRDQEEGFVIPFDVTSYPIWNEMREAEDQLYWPSKAADENTVDDQWLPPDLR